MRQQNKILDKVKILLTVVQQGLATSRSGDSDILSFSYKKNVKEFLLIALKQIERNQEHL